MPTSSRSNRSDAADFRIDTAYAVLHEDERVLVVDKPAPLAVYAIGAYAKINLHDLLLADPRWRGTQLRLAHRLDSETSGALVIAKDAEAARFLGFEFLEGRVSKTYRAVVFGRPAPDEGRIDLPLGKDTSGGFQTVRCHDPLGGQPASTRYRVLEPAPGFSLVEAVPLTGRTHQIRAHLALSGHPIVGDKIYVEPELFRRYVTGGWDAVLERRLLLPRLALHAASITFRHPSTLEPLTVEAPTPVLLSDFWSACRRRAAA